MDIQALSADFSEFISENYKEVINQIIEKNEMRLVVDIDIMRAKKPSLTEKFLARPMAYFNEFQRIVENNIQLQAKVVAKQQQEEYEQELMEADGDMDKVAFEFDSNQRAFSLDRNGKPYPYYLGFTGSFGARHVTPRGLKAHFISSMVCIDGIVTKCSLVRPKVMKSVHFCEKTRETHEKQYSDATLDDSLPTSASYPTKDQFGNPLVTEYGLCEYKDSQCLTIQEMPECSPAGQLPRSVEVLVDNDLVDTSKPGDRIRLIGIYRALPSNTPGQTKQATRFRTVMIVNNIRKLNLEDDGPKIGLIDVDNIKRVSKEPNLFDQMASSIAPSIYGHEYIKKSLLLLLLGGVERNLPNGTHLRGDINLLMVGDPSTAKSQLLRFVLNIAPLAINTTGRGSSGVGLTAAVTSDSETGERRLEAGAMVLADRGIVCIDEFDKMGFDDRVAIHEVMEQQTVTISKAGIHASLNARCSVVAAANPIYGQYNRFKKPHENICLPDSLLSRFDLLFIVLDHANPDHDRHISEHVLRMHRYRKAGDSDTYLQTEPSSVLGGEMEIKQIVEEDIETPVYQKLDKLLHGQRDYELFSIPFLQKYLQYAKVRTTPKLTDEAREFIVESYTNLRTIESEKTLPITTRTLETLIRLSHAHAKCRLSNSVEIKDAEVALDILKHALFSETTVKQKPKPKDINQNLGPKRKKNDKQEEEEVEEEVEEEGEEEEKVDDQVIENDNEEEEIEKEEEEIEERIVQTKKKVKKDNNNNNNKDEDNNNNNNNNNKKINLDEGVIKKFGGELNKLLMTNGGSLDIAVLKRKLSKYSANIDQLLQHFVDKGRIHISKGKVRTMVG